MSFLRTLPATAGAFSVDAAVAGAQGDTMTMTIITTTTRYQGARG